MFQIFFLLKEIRVQIHIVALQQSEMFSMYIFYHFFINNSCAIYNGIEPHNFMTQAHIKNYQIGTLHRESSLLVCSLRQIDQFLIHSLIYE